MTRARLFAVAALLLVPAAAAQLEARGSPPVMEGSRVVIDQPYIAELRVESIDKEQVPLSSPFLVVGHDNVLNLTLRNTRGTWLNATFALNVTGATAAVDEATLSVPPYGYVGTLVAIRPDDYGAVDVVAEATDAFQPGGEPLRAQFQALALAVPSVRFLDPPPSGEAGDEAEREEFRRVSSRGGREFSPIQGHVRLRSGDELEARVLVRNPLDVPTPAFRLRLGATGGPSGPPPIDVPSLDPGQSIERSFAPWQPVPRNPEGGMFYGASVMQLTPMGEFAVAGITGSVGLAAYSIENGAVRDVAPLSAVVEVQDGLAIDLLVPREPILGVPARVKYNVTNLDSQPKQGTLLVVLNTPQRLFYEVQGPESHVIHLDLAPGARTSGTIGFVPRVTGTWGVDSHFRDAQQGGFYYGGGGGGFTVHGPVTILLEETTTVFARIGEPVQVDIRVVTAETLQDASLRATTSAGYSYDRYAEGSSEFQPGLAHRLVEARTASASLGTLRPGGDASTSMELVGRSSGSYTIVPYVLAEGFAYTSNTGDVDFEGSHFGPRMGGAYSLQLAVQSRAVAPAWSLAPLTLALGVFVGTWTLRTRFVR